MRAGAFRAGGRLFADSIFEYSVFAGAEFQSQRGGTGLSLEHFGSAADLANVGPEQFSIPVHIRHERGGRWLVVTQKIKR